MKRYSKLIPAAVGLLAEIVAAGILDGQTQAWASVIIAAAVAAGVYQAPANAAPKAKHAE